jgi:hypothetical protein
MEFNYRIVYNGANVTPLRRIIKTLRTQLDKGTDFALYLPPAIREKQGGVAQLVRAVES